MGITEPLSDFKTSMHDSTPSAPLLISIIESVIGLPPSDVASSAKLWVFSCIILIKDFKTLIRSLGGKSWPLWIEIPHTSWTILSISEELWVFTVPTVSLFQGDLTSSIVIYYLLYEKFNFIIDIVNYNKILNRINKCHHST